MFPFIAWPYVVCMVSVTFERGGNEVFSVREDTLLLPLQPQWFLETSITEVACCVVASKSSTQEALPSG